MLLTCCSLASDWCLHSASLQLVAPVRIVWATRRPRPWLHAASRERFPSVIGSKKEPRNRLIQLCRPAGGHVWLMSTGCASAWVGSLHAGQTTGHSVSLALSLDWRDHLRRGASIPGASFRGMADVTLLVISSPLVHLLDRVSTRLVIVVESFALVKLSPNFAAPTRLLVAAVMATMACTVEFCTHCERMSRAFETTDNLSQISEFTRVTVKLVKFPGRTYQ